MHLYLPIKSLYSAVLTNDATITGKGVIVPGPSLRFNSTKSIHKTKYAVLRVETSMMWTASVV
jgi:hypothetical protein